MLLDESLLDPEAMAHLACVCRRWGWKRGLLTVIVGVSDEDLDERLRPFEDAPPGLQWLQEGQRRVVWEVFCKRHSFERVGQTLGLDEASVVELWVAAALSVHLLQGQGFEVKDCWDFGLSPRMWTELAEVATRVLSPSNQNEPEVPTTRSSLRDRAARFLCSLGDASVHGANLLMPTEGSAGRPWRSQAAGRLARLGLASQRLGKVAGRLEHMTPVELSQTVKEALGAQMKKSTDE